MEKVTKEETSNEDLLDLGGILGFRRKNQKEQGETTNAKEIPKMLDEEEYCEVEIILGDDDEIFTMVVVEAKSPMPPSPSVLIMSPRKIHERSPDCQRSLGSPTMVDGFNKVKTFDFRGVQSSSSKGQKKIQWLRFFSRKKKLVQILYGAIKESSYFVYQT